LVEGFSDRVERDLCEEDAEGRQEDDPNDGRDQYGCERRDTSENPGERYDARRRHDVGIDPPSLVNADSTDAGNAADALLTPGANVSLGGMSV
jgi:hypothetical protein